MFQNTGRNRHISLLPLYRFSQAPQPSQYKQLGQDRNHIIADFRALQQTLSIQPADVDQAVLTS